MSVRVVHGANEGHFSAEVQSVERVMRYLRKVFNIPADASAWVNGKGVERSYILEDGDNLELVQTFGHKGGLQHYWSRDELIEFFFAVPAVWLRGRGSVQRHSGGSRCGPCRDKRISMRGQV